MYVYGPLLPGSAQLLAGGAGSVNLSASQTLDGVSQSATATITVAASASQTLATLTQSAAATIQVAASAAQTLATLTQSATITTSTSTSTGRRSRGYIIG